MVIMKLYTEEKSEIPIKLYTEEQVKEALWKQEHPFSDGKNVDEIIALLTPIELTSDEEIYLMSEAQSEHSLYNMGFKYGAKWMRDKILNK